MNDISYMPLKILYTLDDRSCTSYLARTKTPRKVQVVEIPNLRGGGGAGDANVAATSRIGAVPLNAVVKELFVNSPELLHNGESQDYNVYFKDICEVDEPLVSLGLLSKIRRGLNLNEGRRFNYDSIEEQQQGQDPQQQQQERMGDVDEGTETEEASSDNDVNGLGGDSNEELDDTVVVTGRVCTNFTALLRRSYSSNMSSRKDAKQPLAETLEIKLKLSKITNSRRKDSSTDSPFVQPSPVTIPTPTVSVTPRQRKSSTTSTTTRVYPVPTPTSQVNKQHKIVKPRRQTNPMPAPKASRTQSLPIWNLNLKNGGNNTALSGNAFMKNSIAHKIYLADKMTEANQQMDTQQVSYELNALQNDNTVQKTRIDDSVSKRFDFMLNRKRKPQATKRPKPAAKGKNNTAKTPVSPLNNTCTPKDAVSANNANIIEGVSSAVANKENIPPANSDPSTVGNAITSMDGLNAETLDLNYLNFSDNEINWLADFTSGSTPSMFDNTQHAGVGNPNITKQTNNNKLTPRDVVMEDVDRTSPIDTLSMPLMDLEQTKTLITQRDMSKHPTSCKEQLQRLPLLQPGMSRYKGVSLVGGGKPLDDDVPGSDATVLVNYSTPTQMDKNSGAIEEEDDEDDDVKKNNRTMPSSPGILYGYHKGIRDEDPGKPVDASSGLTADDDDLFSSFVGGHSSDIDDEGIMRGSDGDMNTEVTSATTLNFNSDGK
ncbi:Spt21p KNAG_0F01730 [Huiozyma naganishii CBS 8797]|uniref:Ams2/SPT21 N-terminal domain-containing protein n=1 Tax=Huiozyma naganishii (strain ATCC MYA-139 / BCRC 22969 / CBS 8797 / KCTC 17520 / NBRC 10181 / NCYC 3082 / Yp74L-3) TaxID=1071383 RepID=J7S8C2_HUIN7|nr:hypothetical protein KNAG_0F01730 [Kazachstania naganishii CBS 8797]CCK70841.1 hypothetical protein KNAG_0F01730 [Kazachstania naganishii CBS 8797]